MASREPDRYSRLDYRRLIAWPERIEREAPLLLETLSSGISRRILDLGCGTGEHSRFLAERGFEVVAVDSSESMLASAREHHSVPGLEFLQGDLRDIEQLTEGRFGGAICLGNTLPHLSDPGDLMRLFSGLRKRLETGASLLVQLLNYERIFQRHERFLPLNFRADEQGGEIVFLRLMEPLESGEVLFFPSTLRLSRESEQPLEVIASKKVRLRGWRIGELQDVLEECGFLEVSFYGGFDRSPFEIAESSDLISIAR